MLQAGEVIDVPTGPLYTVVIGRTDVVQVTVRGKPFDLSPFARSSVARFEVQ
jgi:cytoskeleton protein RodZ